MWDLDTGLKLSIEFISLSYVGALLPSFDSGAMVWNNSAAIVVTNPLSQALWTNSRHIASSTGMAYTNLVNYLNENIDQYTVYQPVAIVQSDVNNLINGSTSPIPAILQPVNSYTFVQNVIQQLSKFGCHILSFIQVTTKSFLALPCC